MLDRTYADRLATDHAGREVTVAGHVHERRDLGGLRFVVVRDRTGLVQAVCKADADAAVFEAAGGLDREDVVAVTGEVVASEQAPDGLELHPTGIEVLSEAASSPPLSVAKAHEVTADRSTRLDHRAVDLRRPAVMAVFRLRSKLLAAMTGWFDRASYDRVSTPLLTAAGAEGGAELFPVVYYDREATLAQSPQLYKQLLVGAGFDRLYEVGTAFRAEAFATSRHVSEIAMFDVEVGYVDDHHDVMDVLEDSLRHTLETAVETAAGELATVDVDADALVPTGPVPRIAFEEARRLLREEYDHVPEDPADLDPRGERLLGEHFEERGQPAVFVVGYPDEKFYYRQGVPGDEVASRKFDLLYRGLEVASGGQREHEHDRLVAAMETQGVDPDDFEFYLEGFRYGMPPHGGYGLGIDRLVQQVAGLDHVEEAILFPRDPDRLTP